MAGRFTKEEIESLLEETKLWREDEFKRAQYIYERCRKVKNFHHPRTMIETYD